ncbi:hypothetical protein X798_05236 [Onchocerca flexuosa]|uniref:Uncharacterized protein n=1 Tax=Onchocerca flexuosa TaxID=387005 RepID=A0A238BQW2_9BILA|nr:hypothetical protein X798_05236 [Onchocerca flexuosa]
MIVSNSVSVMPNSMPSFFANPFMTPFMPQAAVSAIPVGSNSGTVESTQLTGPESGDYRSNPLQTGNYVMQSLQCQEMMQHYIQSLIAAASHLPGSNMSSDGATATTKNQDFNEEKERRTYRT